MVKSAQKQSQSRPETSSHPGRLTQHTIGNQAGRALANPTTEDVRALPAAAATTRPAHDFGRVAVLSRAPGGLQSKLNVDTSVDGHKQEADRGPEQETRTFEPQVQRAGAGGKQSSAGGECRACVQKTPPVLQTKLTVSEPGDAYEQEADRIANQVLAAPARPAVGDMPPQIQRLAGPAGGQTDAAPAGVAETLAAPGRPLEPALRREMEQRFGHDFSRVRVHSGAAAEQSARRLNAHAYTVGANIVFGAGRFSPATREGRGLLAHELTHVVQQSSGNLFLGKKGPKDEPEQIVSHKIRIPPGTTSAAVFRRYAELKIFGRVLNLNWNAQGKLPEIYNDISKHIGKEVTFSVPASLIAAQAAGSAAEQAAAQATAVQDYAGLGDEELQGIDQEIDKRYYASTGEEPGTKIQPGETGKVAIWNSFRQQVLADKRRIEALPQDIKDVIFAGGPDAPTITPDNYTQILRIAEKLAKLPPEARQDYLARVNASTASLDRLESSIDSYVQFRGQREKEMESHETAAKPLFGVEDVYEHYRFYQLYLKNVDSDSLGPDASQEDVDVAMGLKQAHLDALMAALKLKGFDSIESFEASIEAYRVAFRTQAVNLALDVLSRYDHMLFEERKKLEQPGGAAAVAQGITGSKAPELYKESRRQKNIALTLQVFHEPEDTSWIEPTLDAEEAASNAHAQAEAEVVRGSGNDPLVSERGTDREKLAGLDTQGQQAYLFETLTKREADVRQARQEFKDDPDRVFKLPDLVVATKQMLGVESGNVYGKIIDNYIADERARHLLSAIAVGILAIALAFLVPGGGWVAAAAMVANAGISTYQAYTAYKEYEEQERDYNLHFLSEEPSLFWVGVAIGAAALDLGVVASVLVKESAAALKALKGPMLEFSKDSDLAKLVSKIEAAEGLRAELKAALAREAKASLAAGEMLKEVRGSLFMLAPGAEIALAVQGVRALYYAVRRGLNTLAKLRADAKFMEAIGDITRMTGAERAELEAAFDEVKQLVKVGSAKSMDETTLLGYIDRLAINRGKPGFQAKLLDEMKAWKPLTAEQQKALGAVAREKTVVTDLYQEKEALLREREELLPKQKNPETRTAENRERLQEINQRLGQLDPTFLSGTTVKKFVRVRNPDGEWVEKIVEVPVTRPPGEIERAENALAKAEKEAAQAEVTLYDRLRAAAPSEAAKERALKGVTTDQVGPLKTPPGPISVDHIVSVREISDMDGFAELPWKDQKAIVDMKENLIPMDRAANSSKSDRSWKSWPQASNYYERPTIDAMIKREADVRAAILAEIQKRLKPTTPTP